MIVLALHAHFKELNKMYDQVCYKRKAYKIKSDNQSDIIFFKNVENDEDTYRKVCYCIALYAKVPTYYLGKKRSGEYIDDNIKVQKCHFDGSLSIFFNQLGKNPIGKKHGHIVIDRFGKIIYYRPIGAPHGPQNYINHPWLMPIQPTINLQLIS